MLKKGYILSKMHILINIYHNKKQIINKELIIYLIL